MSWVFTGLSLFPFPLYKGEQENNVLKLLLYIFPFYMLLTCSYEGIFLIIYYDYLQLWVNMKRKIHKDNKNKFNIIDILFFIFISYTSFYSLTDVDTIRDFNLSAVSRFVSDKKKVKIKTILIMAKALIPGLFVTTAFFEICEIYNYSSLDSLIVLISMVQIMNLKFYYGIRDFGSWAELGMSIAFFVISNLIGLMQIITFSGVKCLFLIGSSKRNYESLKSEPEGILSSNQNIELGLKK